MKPVNLVMLAALVPALAAPAVRAQPAPRPQPGQPSGPVQEPAQPAPQPGPAPQSAQPAQPPASQPADDPAAPPEGVRPMRLSEVLGITVRQEPSLARAVIDVRIAEAGVLEAAGIDDWALRLSGGWSSQRFAGLDRLQDSLTIDGDLSRSLSTGGTVTLHAETGFSDNVFSFGPDDPERNYSHTVYAAISQPLWRGFGEKYARSAQARARIARSAAELELQQSGLDAVRQVVAAYWELAYAWRDLEIRQASLALAQEQLRNTQARISAGAVAPTEALAVEQIIASREESILNAELGITERALNLRGLSGLDTGPGDVLLWASAPVDITPREFDINALLAEAQAQSPALAALQARQRDLTLLVDLAEDEADPALDLDVLLGPTGSGDSPGTAFEELAKLDQITFRAGLTFRHQFGRRTARGRLQAARERLLQLQVDVNAFEERLTRELILAVRQAETAQQRIALGDRVIALAEQNIRAEQARFELGRATNFDVLQRQDELEQAQLSRARAVIDYLQAVTAIDALTGGLLDRYGIQIEPAEG